MEFSADDYSLNICLQNKSFGFFWICCFTNFNNLVTVHVVDINFSYLFYIWWLLLQEITNKNNHRHTTKLRKTKSLTDHGSFLWVKNFFKFASPRKKRMLLVTSNVKFRIDRVPWLFIIS